MRALVLVLCLLASPAAAETVAIVGAKVWTGAADRPLEAATVVIRDGRIVSVGPGSAPTGARVIDGTGRVVTPPLVAAATQIGLVEVSGAPDTDDRAVASGPLGAAFEAARGFDPNGLPVQEARVEGVGRALIHPGAPGTGVFAGQAAMIALGAETATVERPGAAQLVHAGGAAAEAAGGSRGAVWTQVALALAEAREVAARPETALGHGRLLNRADALALRPVIRREAPLAIVANREADIREAIALAKAADIRVVILGGAEAWRAAPALAAAGIPLVLDPLDDLPVSHDAIGARRDNAALLAASGVEIAFSVSGQGVYLSYNLGPALRLGAGIAAANGLPYARALDAITLAPGRIWGGAPVRPGLTPGASADLVLWDGDPLEPASAPVAVFVGGREVSRVTRQTLLRDRYAPKPAPR